MPRPDQKEAMMMFPFCVADASGARGIHRIIGVTGAGTSFALPSAWKGRYLYVIPYGGGVQAAVGAQQVLAWNQASAPGTGHVAAGARADDTGGRRWLEGIVPGDATYFNYVAETGKTIDLELWVSECAEADLLISDRP